MIKYVQLTVDEAVEELKKPKPDLYFELINGRGIGSIANHNIYISELHERNWFKREESK